MAKFTQEQRERAIFIQERANKMLQAKQHYSSNWPLYEKIFKLWFEERTGDDKWRASLPDTWSYATIKTAQAAFADSKVVPNFQRHEDEDQAKANDQRDLYVDLAEKGALEQELYYVRLDAFKLGLGILETIYLEDKRKVQEIQSFDPETGEIKYKEKEIKDFDDPITLRVSPYMILFDEMAKADFRRTCRDAIKIEILEYEEAKRVHGHLVKNWDELIPRTPTIRNLVEPIQGAQVAQTADTNTGPVTRSYTFFAPIDIADSQVEILHYYSKNMGVLGTDTYEILINGEPVQVDTKKKPAPIPYIHKQLPYTPVPYSPYSGDELWAAGIIEVGRADAMAIRMHREMMTDRQKVSLFSPVFADANTEIDQRQLKLRPLSVIRVRGGTPHNFQIPGLNNADLELVRNYEESFKRSVGVDERVLGSSTDRLRLTATEIGLIREASLRRLKEFTSMLYKNALVQEVKMKMRLFEQYYSSPLKREPRVKNDSGVKRLVAQARQFKINLGKGVYKKKAVYTSMFEGDIDIDLDMRFLLPASPSELVAKWGQIIRDSLPVAQAIGIDISKLYKKYYEALEVDINTLREDKEAESVKTADGEHALFADPAHSTRMKELLPNGTWEEFLTPAHIQRHHELMQQDTEIEVTELKNLTEHIALDTQNLQVVMQKQRMEQQAQLQMNPQNVAQIGGVKSDMGQPA